MAHTVTTLRESGVNTTLNDEALGRYLGAAQALVDRYGGTSGRPEALFDAAVVELVKLDLGYNGVREFWDGKFRQVSFNLDQERTRILRGLVGHVVI